MIPVDAEVDVAVVALVTDSQLMSDTVGLWISTARYNSHYRGSCFIYEYTVQPIKCVLYCAVL